MWKKLRKLSLGRVPKQTCSQSAVRGVSTLDMEERAFSEQLSRATEKIEMADKKTKEENGCGTIRQEVGPV